MRAVSLLYIVGFWHLHNYTDYLPWYRAAPFARVTVVALALFVLISGFFAGRPSAPITAPALRAYYRKRLIRVYPPYLAALVVFTALGLSGAAFLPSALMVNMIVPPPPYTLWFMTMIVLFYLVAPFMLALAHRPGQLIGIVGATWIALLLVDRTVLDIEDRLLVYLPAFALGVLLAGNPVRRRARVLAMAALGSVAGYGLSLRAPLLDPDQSLWMVLWASSGAVFLFVALQATLPRSRLVEQLSLGGFFLYLFHRPIYVAVLKLTGAQAPVSRELVLVGLALPLAIVFGVVAQRAYDGLVDRLTRPRRTRALSPS